MEDKFVAATMRVAAGFRGGAGGKGPVALITDGRSARQVLGFETHARDGSIQVVIDAGSKHLDFISDSCRDPVGVEVDVFVLGVRFPLLIDGVARLGAEGIIVAIAAGRFPGRSASRSQRTDRGVRVSPAGKRAVEGKSALGSVVYVQDVRDGVRVAGLGVIGGGSEDEKIFRRSISASGKIVIFPIAESLDFRSADDSIVGAVGAGWELLEVGVQTAGAIGHSEFRANGPAVFITNARALHEPFTGGEQVIAQR